MFSSAVYDVVPNSNTTTMYEQPGDQFGSSTYEQPGDTFGDDTQLYQTVNNESNRYVQPGEQALW